MKALALVMDESTSKSNGPKPEPTPFGIWLKDNRTREGMTQEELGKAANCTGAYVSGLERGTDRSKPAPAIVDAWAKALGRPENEARRIAGHPPILTTKEEADRVILDYYEAASPESQEIMRAVLKTIYEVDMRRGSEAEAKEAPSGMEEIEAGDWPSSEAAAKDETATTRDSKKGSKRR